MLKSILSLIDYSRVHDGVGHQNVKLLASDLYTTNVITSPDDTLRGLPKSTITGILNVESCAPTHKHLALPRFMRRILHEADSRK